MELPTIAKKTQDEAFIDILESIALEGTGIAKLLNAEGEELQTVAYLIGAGKVTPEEAIKLQLSVAKVIQAIIKVQILLEFKLDSTLEGKIDKE